MAPLQKGRKFFKYLLIDYSSFACLNPKGYHREQFQTEMFVAFLLYASHVAQVPNTGSPSPGVPGDGEDQVPMSTPLDLSACPHSPAQQLLGTGALPLTDLQRIMLL